MKTWHVNIYGATIQCLCILQIKVVCLDRACFSKIRNSFESQQCAEPTIHLATDIFMANVTTDGTKSSSSPEIDPGGVKENEVHLSAFAKYKTDSFNSIVRYKFEAISYFLARKRVVLYTDGDIVFLRRSFLRESVASLGMWRGGNGELR